MKNELIKYLRDRSEEISNKLLNYELSYDMFPQWVWDETRSLSFEQNQIGRFIKFLEEQPNV